MLDRLPIYQRELTEAKNDDRRVSIAYWNWLALKRLGRCQPLSRKFGFDPVPDASDSVPPMAYRRSLEAGSSAVTHREVLS